MTAHPIVFPLWDTPNSFDNFYGNFFIFVRGESAFGKKRAIGKNPNGKKREV